MGCPVSSGGDQTEPIMKNFIRFASLLACGCLAMTTAMACDDGSDGDATGGGGDGPAEGTGGTSGGGPAEGGAAGGAALGIAQICPELVAAACPTLATFLPNEAACQQGLPMLGAACSEAVDGLYTCTGPDPDITCDSTTGAPTSEGCEAEWGAVMTCVAALMSQGDGGAGGAGG